MPPKFNVNVCPPPRPAVNFNSSLYNFLIIGFPQHLEAIVGASSQDNQKAAIHRLTSILLELIRINAISCGQLEQNRRKVLRLCKTFPPGAAHCPHFCSPPLGQPSHDQQLRGIDGALNQLTSEGFYLHSLLTAVTSNKQEGPPNVNCCTIFSQAQPQSTGTQRSETPWTPSTPPLPTTPPLPSSPPLPSTPPLPPRPSASVTKVTTPGPLLGAPQGKRGWARPAVVIHTVDVKDEVCEI